MVERLGSRADAMALSKTFTRGIVLALILAAHVLITTFLVLGQKTVLQNLPSEKAMTAWVMELARRAPTPLPLPNPRPERKWIAVRPITLSIQQLPEISLHLRKHTDWSDAARTEASQLSSPPSQPVIRFGDIPKTPPDLLDNRAKASSRVGLEYRTADAQTADPIALPITPACQAPHAKAGGLMLMNC